MQHSKNLVMRHGFHLYLMYTQLKIVTRLAYSDVLCHAVHIPKTPQFYALVKN